MPIAKSYFCHQLLCFCYVSHERGLLFVQVWLCHIFFTMWNPEYWVSHSGIAVHFLSWVSLLRYSV